MVPSKPGLVIGLVLFVVFMLLTAAYFLYSQTSESPVVSNSASGLDSLDPSTDTPVTQAPTLVPVPVATPTPVPAATPTPVPASTPTPAYTYLPFIDRPGGDISTTTAPTLAACETLCGLNSSCNGIVYDSASQTCWLKSNLTNQGIINNFTPTRGLGFVNNIFPSSLSSPSKLASSSALLSPSSKFALLMQSDGNLCVYDLTTGKATWASNTSGKGALSFAIQNDGNNVLYDASGRGVWATNDSNTRPSDTYTLKMQDDGNLVAYTSAGVPVWASQSKVSLFADCNYGGKSTTISPGFYNVMPNGFPNDALSSLQLQGPVTVVLYADTNYGGKSFTVKSSNPCVTAFNDVTSSFKVLGLF